jgi:SpoVK/Ycf46/Vps4 family AAA+-type ATPase
VSSCTACLAQVRAIAATVFLTVFVRIWRLFRAGKTLLAKAVANQTSATFLRVVGSELIQKYLGDGPKLVRELFRVADDLSPSIVFIDEIDAVGTKRCVRAHMSMHTTVC